MNNLLDNAVRHAKARTRIRVSCEQREDCTRISVENQGEPIPAEELPKIWDRYHRAPQHGEAAGSERG
jgi:two-component system heavy metal sensor histidine kinase CusS